MNTISKTLVCCIAIMLFSVQAKGQAGDPTAAFSSSNTIGKVASVFNFTDQSVNATSWEWDFGDGGASTDQNPAHSFAAEGEYTVKLTVSNGTTGAFTTKSVYVYDGILMHQGSETIAGPVNFYDPGTQWGNYDNNSGYELVFYPAIATNSVVINFSAFDTESCCDNLQIYNGTTSDAELLMVIKGQPTTPIVVSASNPQGALCVKFSSDNSQALAGWAATVSTSDMFYAQFTSNQVIAVGHAEQFTDLSKSATSWNWNFGDGTTSTDKNPLHTYTAQGTYTVTLTASDGTNTAELSKVVYVHEGIAMNNGSTSMTAATYFYDSGANFINYKNQEDYQHVFYPSTPGYSVKIDFSTISLEDKFDMINVYNGENESADLLYSFSGQTTAPVSVTASNSKGALCVTFGSDNSRTQSGWEAVVTQAELYYAYFNSDQTVTTTNQTIQFTDGSAPSTSWAWDFGDGTTSTAQNPTHAFTATGIYTVKLNVSDGTNSSSVTRNIKVYDGIAMHNGNSYISAATNFYDSGSPWGDYQNYETFTHVFYPASAGYMVEIKFSELWTEENYDYIRIYDGENASGDLLLASNGQNTTSPTVTASNPAGALCVTFVSDYSRSKSGWKAIVNQIAPIATPVQQPILGSQINVYPTRFTDQLNVDMVDRDGAKYTMMGITGKVIKAGSLTKGTNQLEVSDLQNGVYLLKIGDGAASTTFKVVKSH